MLRKKGESSKMKKMSSWDNKAPMEMKWKNKTMDPICREILLSESDIQCSLKYTVSGFQLKISHHLLENDEMRGIYIYSTSDIRLQFNVI